MNNIHLPLFLLAVFTLAAWVLRDSSVRLWLKVTTIGALLLFSTIFWQVSNTMFGWASQGDLPDHVAIRAAVIKEPVGDYAGAIYILVESNATRYNSVILSLFAYKPDMFESRLYRLPYSRRLHEQMEGQVMPRLKQGQTVHGRFVKPGSGKEGKGKGDRKGVGSESLESGPEFYELPPTYIQRKPDGVVPKAEEPKRGGLKRRTL